MKQLVFILSILLLLSSCSSNKGVSSVKITDGYLDSMRTFSSYKHRHLERGDMVINVETFKSQFPRNPIDTMFVTFIDDDIITEGWRCRKFYKHKESTVDGTLYEYEVIYGAEKSEMGGNPVRLVFQPNGTNVRYLYSYRGLYDKVIFKD